MHVVQLAELALGAISPSEQSSQTDAPVDAVMVPGAQLSQVALPVAFWNLPAEHSMHDALPAADAYLPLSHASQLPWPEAGWALPAAQSVHDDAPV